MQAQAYEGYFENGQFYAAGNVVRIPERRKVFVTVLDELIQKKPLEWLDELERMVKEDTIAFTFKTGFQPTPLNVQEAVHLRLGFNPF